jgi:cellulose synthase/poly-beta-1,6-N-acetylglucosamine synthase-like glycosyltransferase
MDRSYRRTRRFRFFEMIPGAVLWGTFIVGIALSFIRPLWVVVFIIAFSFYWLLRVIYFVVYLIAACYHYHRHVRIDWLSRLEQEARGADRERVGDWHRIHHLVFLPTVQEPIEVLRQTFAGLQRTAYPKDRFTIVLAGEERAGVEEFQSRAATMAQEFGDTFTILVTVHPKDIPGEVIGKGANLHYAGARALEEMDRRGIPREDVLVSAFDVDTVVHPQYFSALTWAFLHHPNKHRTSFQPVALYNNNMWESNAALRITAFGTTFWLLTELAESRFQWVMNLDAFQAKMKSRPV